MKSNVDISSSFSYLKYIGLPLAFGITVSKLYTFFCKRKRRSILKGKVVVITGASSGIGEALAHAFYDYGSKVVLVARREPELNRVKENLISKTLSISTQEPVVLRLDLAELDSLEPFIQKVYDVCGHIDILINNGGVSHRGSILNTNIDVDKQIMSINYLGPVGLTKVALPKMVASRNGHIVFVSSVQGRIAIPNRSAYAASKHALQAFADSLRAEMHQHNVNVSLISPGYIKTNISLNALTGSGQPHGEMDPDTAAGFTAEYTAEKILDMVVNKDDELVLSQFLPKLAIFIRYFSPTIYFWLMARRAKKSSV